MVAKEEVTTAVKLETTSGKTAEGLEPQHLKHAKTSANISEAKAEHVGTTKVNRKRVDASYVGWQQIGGWEEKDVLTAEDELLDLNRETILNSIVPDSLYGDWYHSVAIFFVAGFLSFLFGYWKFSLAPVFLVVLVTCIFYRTNAKKYRASIRDLVQKEFTVQKVEDDYESLEWLNSLLDKYWPIIEPSVSKIVVEQVNEVLATNENIPTFVSAVWLDQFTLGIKPPRIDLAKTFQHTDSDVVVMDWGISFTPHDLSDTTAKQLRNYVNQKVVVKATMFGITIPVSVSDVAFRAQTRVRFKLMTPFPHVETVNVQLLEVPKIDFKACLLGDSVFNWEILSIPGLYALIDRMAAKYMGPVLLPPFSLQLNIPQLLSNSNLSIGVLEVTIKNAKNIKRSTDILNTSVDPYLTFEFLGKTVGKTRIVRDTLNPIWNETMYLLLSTFTDPLTITLYDKREALKDKQIGRVEYNLNSLHDETTQRDLKCHFLRNSKPIGDLNFDLRFFPTLQAKKLPNGIVEELPDLNTGIAKVIIEEIDGVNETGKKQSYYVDLYMNAKRVLTTGKVATDEDIFKFNEQYEAVISDRRLTRYRFIIKDSKTDEIVGSTVQSLSDLIDRTEVDNKLIPVKGDSKAQLKITTYWKPVALDIGSNAIAYTPPIGVMRVYLSKATGLKNLEKIGKIDPYAKVLVNGISRGRTVEQPQTLNPVWNQPIYVAVTSPNQRLTLEVMDVETINKDRSVGKFDLKIQEYFKKDNKDRYVEHINKSQQYGRLITKKGPMGELSYYLSFYPVHPVMSLEEIQDSKKVQERKIDFEKRKAGIDEKKLSTEARQKYEEEKMELQELEFLYSNKIKMDLNELLTYKSGVLAVTVLDGELPQAGLYVQAFFDSNGYPRFTSPKIPTRIVKTGWTGDVVIKELDVSETIFRVTKHKNASRVEDAFCEVKIHTLDLVKSCYYKPSIINMAGEGIGKIMVQISWFPLNVEELPQSDLMSNEGDLTVLAKSAEGLDAADTNGFSDPYLKFYVNESEDKAFKTHIEKKTLNPVWNETGVISIKNRVNDTLHIKVMDWDATSADDLLGWAEVKLSQVKPHETTELDVPVINEQGKDAGIIHLEFKFEPKYVINVNKKETKAGDLASKGIGSGLKAGGTIVNAGGKVIDTGFGTIGKIGKGVGKGVFGRKGGNKKSA
ncbi:hypothetical protein KAFR_0J01830 [Kazachstania africana CBS 2517]|uniref:Tricalbin n=1 Tax=Kazachstania africana (strain ATCC 22294 / BCRC 22015 / CBS 2517 / CECT 1963 / NBRC 1671 / NRRL Y-8276) TaxID=1071382 RepID=H2B0U7_KAZAF|nr:hypothetical protein KAFR_0J01830 [Kazachstania africana CBS 2517]CCF60247.1 hypothetical protein KAFR_0J01830 [Kazachstania africana CBS 2517]